MQKLLLILLVTLSFSAFAQTSKKEKPKSDTTQASGTSGAIQLTGETKFISLNDLYRKADLYKDSVMARQYESFMVLFNAVIDQIINDQKKKN